MASHELIQKYGVLIVFFNTFCASLGLPLPAVPTLLAVGSGLALASDDPYATLLGLTTMVAAASIGAVLGDMVWFHVGRRYGENTLRGVLRLFVSGESHLPRTQRLLERWGGRILIVARWIPGLSLFVVPLCGATAVKLRAFLIYDCIGVILWAAIGVGTGELFASRIDVIWSVAPRLI
ncbi:membrane-associated protein [Pararobbsia alpina]|uniref:DedA family protein n=1 Tax=Pararobbsia alpina TaxID=621374 RepID=UPI0039A46B36